MSADGLDAFRHELRTWLAAHVPADLQPEQSGRLSEVEGYLASRAASTKGIIAMQFLGLPRGT